jgi:hypothetical protein
MSLTRGKGRVILELSDSDHCRFLVAVGYAAGAAAGGKQSPIHDSFVRLLDEISDEPDISDVPDSPEKASRESCVDEAGPG